MASSLSRGDARLYAQRFIVSGIRAGQSGTEILSMLRSFSVDGVSLGYNTQQFFIDYNKYLKAKTLPRITTFETLPEDLNLQYTYPRPTAGRSRVMYVMTLNGYNSDTNEQMQQTVSIVSPFPINSTLLPHAFQSVDFGTDYNMVVDWENSVFENPIYFDSSA